MRISKAGLLVVAAIIIPIVVEFRTALSWFGIELSVLEGVALAVAIVLAIVVWAVWPSDGNGNAETEPTGPE
ncbi:CbaC protein [Haloterrigena salifodinae]|uniref:CbaC protein n=1 Tax=Haloterrigena salifodinae TaxID=2675099 RepID=A0A8T8E418_9EURY|nr:CbaC protein [Haloterrigena salifodinae]QRV16595.1 CbaC protein [Haloterrigena salifodinae]